MRTKLYVIGLIWLLPLACWFGSPAGDRVFAIGIGALAAMLLTMLLAIQPMLKCGACGAGTSYFKNYTLVTARWHGNWRRYFICGSCGTTIDRCTGMPFTDAPDTPAIPPPSRSELANSVSNVGCLLIFVSVVIGSIVVLDLTQIAPQSERLNTVLAWSVVGAAIGAALFFAGRFSFRKR